MKVSRGAMRLFDCLTWFGKRHGFDSIFPLQSTLARLLKCSVQTVLRWLSELKRAGIVVARKYGRQAAHYELSQETVQSRVTGKSERSAIGLREVGERSNRLGPFNSSNRTSRTAWVIERRKPPQPEKNYILPQYREAMARWPMMSEEERTTWLKTLDARSA